jgi:UDP-N-acetylmuramoyl-tripeptide--D-alanyl-D-alanine ligase
LKGICVRILRHLGFKNMKKILRKFVLLTLKWLAKRRLKKFKGKVIAVTGSVGKTSTKEAVFAVLNSQFRVRRSQKSMNSEFGLLLTILDIESGYSSAYKWSLLLLKAFYNSLLKDHSDILLLEFGVDKPGDMDFLLSVAKPDIGVLTNIFPVHLAEGQFADLQAIFEEKRKVIDALDEESGMAILNIDNPYIENLAKSRKKKNTITFGREGDCDYKATGIELSPEGLKFNLNHDGKRHEVNSHVLGEYHAYVIMPAIICGLMMGMELPAAIKAIDRYSLPPGRMTVIRGIEDSLILDSSYNSSPEPLKEALKVLNEIAGRSRRVAVLGSMNELGENTDEMHELVGKILPKYVDLLISVGKEGSIFAHTAKETGMNEKNVFSFVTASQAAEFFKKEVKKGDIVLVKGSQNKVRLERFIKELMEHPEEAKNVLVRQENVWENIV